MGGEFGQCPYIQIFFLKKKKIKDRRHFLYYAFLVDFYLSLLFIR